MAANVVSDLTGLIPNLPIISLSDVEAVFTTVVIRQAPKSAFRISSRSYVVGSDLSVDYDSL